jgi:protein SCO1
VTVGVATVARGMSIDTPTAPPSDSGPEPDEPSDPSAPADDRIRLVAGLVAIGAALLLVVAVVATVARGSDDDAAGAETSASADGDDWGGTLLDPAQARPDFTLTDTDGRPYDFAAETQGQLTLLFFGYTNCPDICPIQMAVLSGALDTPGMPEPVVVFVTTDPQRDTPARLRDWLDRFDASYVGLTGTVEQIAAAESAARVAGSVRASEQGDGSEGGDDYEVGHAAQVIAYTPDDRAHLVYPSGVRQQDWTADLPRMLDEWGRGDGSP